jgi:hypothetical protein
METVYTLLSSTSDYIFPIRSYKGITNVTFILSSINAGNKDIININANFGNDTDIVERVYNFDSSVALHTQNLSCVLNPASFADIKVYYPRITITYSDFTRYNYEMPINIYRDSFYSAYENLNIASTQFVDVSSNDRIVIFDTGKGDGLNLIIK